MLENCHFGLQKPELWEEIPHERLEQLFWIPLNNQLELLIKNKGESTKRYFKNIISVKDIDRCHAN